MDSIENDELTPFDEAALEIAISVKQEVFVQEYLIDLNAAQAALRAGYAASTGTNFLREPAIVARIRVAQAQRRARTQVTQDSVLHEMSLLANSRLDWFCISDKGEVTLTAKAPEGALGCIASVDKKITVHAPRGDNPGYTVYDVKLKFWDKPTPLKLMGRHVGLFPDKVEHTGPGGGPIETVTKIERVIIRAGEKTA